MDWRPWMTEALALAMEGRGAVEPNPRVGALALERGKIVGRGVHRHWGAPHAEVEALAQAREAAAKPDTLVVTLEPCSAAFGEGGKKTPPCVDLLLEAGIRTVVVGMQDPDPRHRGRGLAKLENEGVEVVDGVLAEACRSANAPFLRGLGLDRPWTIAKWAMTLDGKTAAPSGEARWISGLPARVKVHELRTQVDAVVIGFRTVLTDDPELNVRHVAGAQPIRIVVDPRAAISLDSKLVHSARQQPLWLLVLDDADAPRCAQLEALGVTLIRVKAGEQPQRLHLREGWRELRRRGLRRVLVEGGGELVAQLFAWECVDQILAFVAPKLIGGRGAPSPIGGLGKGFMAEAWRLSEMVVEPCGDDLAISAFVS